ncbi:MULTISPECIES: hypothetical protein [unclassified Plantactinospora]|uniref:hypothetical protein n=1 Tax=unclassified Plantactinospora TaxID=2631981 RepID=UPI000D175ACC|nr:MULTISPECIES: hypothetical protein [unclassified Plantactinospora]AVT29836.1 hypothetical protein C6361_10410 [Plantactinospora sp. BC1]AVT36343.1 hypothetical protein C6W10_07510 [Plantactinospora sp. BB1]
MSTQVPRLFAGLVDDAAVFPPGSASLPDAVAAHRRHRNAWYAPLVGPLLLPASALPTLPALLADDERIDVGVIGDVPVEELYPLRDRTDPRIRIRQVEMAVAKRGEDPLPGLAALAGLPAQLDDADVYAEVPLTWGLLGALDRLADERAAGRRIAAKFRTGGLAAELFPTPVELAAVIGACRDRELPFKLTAGLHHAIRHIDPETGFTHHGFVNILAATAVACSGAEVAAVAETLAATDPLPLVEAARSRREEHRPLWIGFGSCSVMEPLIDLVRLGLVNGGFES